MTTIACRDNEMAADSRLVLGCEDTARTPMKMQKIFRIPRGPNKGHLVGIAGSVSAALRFVEWYTNPKLPKPPTVADGDDDTNDFDALILSSQGMFLVDSTLVFMPILDEFAAIGTGDEAALAAMHCGKSAADAVEIAKLVDVGTGGEVQVESLRRR